MARYKLTEIASYTAMGGFASKDIDKEMRDDGYGSTSAGVYTIHKIEPHRSYGRWANSSVPWGTKTKITPHKVVKVFIGSKWKRLSSMPKWSMSSEKAVLQNLLSQYDDLFNSGSISQMMILLSINRIDFLKKMGTGYIKSSPANREIPDKWMLNDFGHKSIKYFKDKNHDGRLDKNENRNPQFIHSSPSTEMWDNIGLLSRNIIKNKMRISLKGSDSNFNNKLDKALLTNSHGCIHAFPNDIDTMVNKGYLKKRGIVQVHKYKEKSKSILLVNRRRTLTYEVHFYPFDSKVVVYKTHKLS